MRVLAGAPMQLVLAALVVAGITAAAAIGAARAEVPVPPLKARVTDLTGTLSAQQRNDLEARIAAYESRRGSQIAVLLLPTTRPEEIEQYSIRVAEAWKIGRKGVDDGIVLVIAKDDRRLRIEVGYGLEGVIPDALARRVIDERIVPRFRDGDFYGGVRDGVDQLIRLAEGEKLPPPASGARGGRPAVDPIAFVVVAMILMTIFPAILKAKLGRIAGALLSGAILGAAAGFLFGAFFGVLGFVFGSFIAYVNAAGGGGSGWSSGSGGSWGGGSGSWGGGSSSSSSSSWGGGGGGGFGGGGSSGRW